MVTLYAESPGKEYFIKRAKEVLKDKIIASLKKWSCFSLLIQLKKFINSCFLISKIKLYRLISRLKAFHVY